MAAKAENLSVRLPTEVRQKVDALARASRRSRSFIINEAVAYYVDSQAELNKEIDEAIALAESGVGHSSEQVFAWMDEWIASGQKPPLPKPDLRPKKKRR